MPLVGINSQFCCKEHILSDGTMLSSFKWLCELPLEGRRS